MGLLAHLPKFAPELFQNLKIANRRNRKNRKSQIAEISNRKIANRRNRKNRKSQIAEISNLQNRQSQATKSQVYLCDRKPRLFCHLGEYTVWCRADSRQPS